MELKIFTSDYEKLESWLKRNGLEYKSKGVISDPEEPDAGEFNLYQVFSDSYESPEEFVNSIGRDTNWSIDLGWIDSAGDMCN